MEAPVQATTSVTDLVSGVTANDVSFIQKLANGEIGPDVLQAIVVSAWELLNSYCLYKQKWKIIKSIIKNK